MHHLAIFAVMLLALAPQTASFWQCEGEPCGPAAWVCCCSQPNDNADPACSSRNADLANQAHLDPAGLAASDCHCTMKVQDADQPIHSAAYSFVTPIQFVVAPVYAFVPQQAPEIETPRPQLSRGPPLNSVCLSTPSLRGPPIA